jgi:hypothetical protein
MSHHEIHLRISPDPSDGLLAGWAFRLAVAAPLSIGTALALFGIATAIGGPDATADNWVGILVGAGLIAAFLTSLAAFTLAIAAKVNHQRVLWLPIAAFPAVLAFLLLGEAFWWE